MSTVRDLCKGELIGINSDASIARAAILMDEKSVGFLVVSDLNGRPVGVITDRDIALRAVAHELDTAVEPVQTIMSSTPVTITDWADLEHALKMMALYEIRRLIVTDLKGNYVGVICAEDIFRHLAEEMGQLAAIYFSQNRFVKPSHSADYTKMA